MRCLLAFLSHVARCRCRRSMHKRSSIISTVLIMVLVLMDVVRSLRESGLQAEGSATAGAGSLLTRTSRQKPPTSGSPEYEHSSRGYSAPDAQISEWPRWGGPRPLAAFLAPLPGGRALCS